MNETAVGGEWGLIASKEQKKRASKILKQKRKKFGQNITTYETKVQNAIKLRSAPTAQIKQ